MLIFKGLEGLDIIRLCGSPMLKFIEARMITHIGVISLGLSAALVIMLPDKSSGEMAHTAKIGIDTCCNCLLEQFRVPDGAGGILDDIENVENSCSFIRIREKGSKSQAKRAEYIFIFVLRFITVRIMNKVKQACINVLTSFQIIRGNAEFLSKRRIPYGILEAEDNVPMGLFKFSLMISVLIHILIMQDSGEVVTACVQQGNTIDMGLIFGVKDCNELPITEFGRVSHITSLYLTHRHNGNVCQC